MGVVFLGGCWADRGSCDLWAAKLRQGLEATTAVDQLAANGCVGQRDLLLAHLDDPGLGADALGALITLGQSPESEQAVLRMLARPETVSVAAQQAKAWKLAAAEAPIRAALADDALASHHAELYAAAVAVAPADRWLDAVAHELAALHGQKESVTKAFEVLVAVDWGTAPAAARGPVVEVLADLLSRPEGSVPAERLETIARELARVPRPDPLPALTGVVTRAAEGSRAALLVLWALGHPAASDTALSVATWEGTDPAVRAAALAYLADPRRTPRDLATRVASAPGDAEVLSGLALLGGESVVAALEARAESDKGTARAASSRALALALPAARLDAWAAGLTRQASILMRGIPEDPTIVACTDATRACGADAGCWIARLDAALPALDTLGADLAAAQEAVAGAQKSAQAAVAEDAARAQELAKATGDGLAAARAELDAIQKRRDAAYAAVAEATERLDKLSAVARSVPFLLRRSMSVAGEGDAKKLGDAALAVLSRCRGAACAPARTWAVAALRTGGAHPNLSDAIAANQDDPALTCLLAVDEVARP